MRDIATPVLDGVAQVPPPVGGRTERQADVRVRRMSRADLPEVLSLLRLSLGAESRAGHPDYWGWKHEQNPFGSSPCLVAEAEGKIVGLRAFLRWELEWRGERVRAVRAVDTATHPDWQRRGIFSRLTRGLLADCEDEGVGLVFNTPNERSRPGYVKMGWQVVGRPTLMTRMRSPLRVASALLRNSGGASTDGGSAPDFPKVADLLAHIDVERVLGATNGAGSEHDAGSESAGQGRQLSIPMKTSSSAEYLAWRYRDVPGVSYSAIWDERHPGAALVFSLKERAGLHELSLAEVLAASERDVVHAARLLRRVWRRTEADYAIAVASRDTTSRAALRRAFFLPVPGRGPVLCARPLAALPAVAELFDLRNWQLSLGDLELF